MAGDVTDPSGAVVPDVTVTLTNPGRALKYSQMTNSGGSYRFTNIPPGPGYEATFEHAGFATVDVKDIYLTVSTVRTQDVKLTVASTEVHVEVTASNSEVTIDTTDASIGNTFDVDKLNNLPVQQRNDPTALFTAQPGVTDQGSTTGARTDQNAITLDGLDVVDQATGGAVQNNSGITQGFGGTIVGHAPVDSVQEFHATVGGYGASSTGAGSGGQFALVTKSGTNQFHGNINEYHRDASLVANSWFSNNASPVIPRNHLIQNQFGGDIGGPVMKNKLFFFFDYNNSKIISSQVTFRTVPLDSLRAGTVNYINSAGTLTGLTPANVKALDPAGIGESNTFLCGSGAPTGTGATAGDNCKGGIGIDARFPHSNAAGGDSVNSGGFDFNAPNNNDETNYIGRVDYNINSSMKAFARFTIARQNAVSNVNEFAGDTITDPFIDRTYAFVLGHNWVIGANKTNRVFLGETVEKYAFPNNFNPDGSSWFLFSDGTQAALSSTLYLNPAFASRRIPVPVVGDDFAVTKGNHTLQFGGTFKDILAKYNNAIDYNATEIGLGGQILDLCGPTPGDCGLTGTKQNPSLRPADINTSAASGGTASNTYDQAFAFMLGRIANVQSDFLYNSQGAAVPQLSSDQRIYQSYQTQLYVQDTWKALPDLTLNFGLNYQLFTVPYETRGFETVEPLTLSQYMAARVAQSALSQTGPTAVPLITYGLGGKANNAPPLFPQEYKNIAPSFGFSWNPGFDKKSVINGGAGVVYDRTIINAVQQIQDQYSYLFEQTLSTSEGIAGDPYDSIKGDPRLDANNGISTVSITPPPVPRPYQPFTNNGVPFGLVNGLAFNSTIDPGLKTPYSIYYNFGVQHQFQGDLVLKASYVGRLGRRLLAQADAEQILDFADPVSGQYLSQAFAAMTKQVRAGATGSSLPAEAFFENVVSPGLGASQGFNNNTDFLASFVTGLIRNGDFGDFVQFLSNFAPQNVGSAAQFSENTFYSNGGFSTYNGLLMSLQKNLSHGLQFDLNYTLSHSIDNVSFFANSMGDTGIGGIGLVCDVIRPRECRANSDFDVRHYITADETYQLPIGRNRMFLSDMPLWGEEILGGWDISGVTEWHSGLAWGTDSNAFVASYSNNAPAILIGSKSAVATGLTKLPGGGVNVFSNAVTPSGSQRFEAPQAHAAYEGPIGFAIGPRNGLRGPRFFNQDLGLAKNFPVYAERVNLKFRADAFNAFNHPNFAVPLENVFNGFDQQDVTSTTFGDISNTVDTDGNNGARVLQLSLRLEF
jgi:hypothetical protein